ncbi:MAG: hypothetical protein IKF52_06100 [Clostridia bacterium]|nr:hypothetical protein [Clostridia bacterium]
MEELDLKEVLKMFYEKKVLIIVCILGFAIIGACYSMFIMTPKYKASTTLVLTKTQETSVEAGVITDSITQTDVTLNQKLVATYSEIIKSSNILRQVIKNLPTLDITEAELRKNIVVTSKEETEVIEISVTNENPEYSAKIANEIANVFAEKITEMYKINNVYILDVAEIPDKPANIKPVKYTAIFAAVGFILACGYILIRNMFDNTTKNKDDIEKLTGVPVLVSLTKYDSNKKGGSKK